MKKRILLAETHLELNNSIREFISKIKNIEILNETPINSEEMKKQIELLQPDIVITNEEKEDIPATSVIKEIQDDLRQFQPKFIIISGYDEIPFICKEKEISAYFVLKPFDFLKFTKMLNDIVNGRPCEKYYQNYNYSQKNLKIVEQLVCDNCKYFCHNQKYVEINKEIDNIIESSPFWLKDKIRHLDQLIQKSNTYEKLFLYQYMKNNK